ncbi:Uncharacterized protein ABC855_g3842 [[Candida] zeylanoides]
MAALDEFTSEHFGFKLSTGPRGVQVFDALPAAALARPVRLLAIANAAGYFACSDTRCVVVEATAQLRGAADADAAAWRRIAASDVTQVCFSADERRLYVVDGGLVKVVTDFEAGEMRPVGAGAGGVMEIAPSPSGDGFLELRGGADGADGADGDLYLGTTLVASRVSSFAWGIDGSVLYAAEGVVWRARPEGGAGGAERVFGDDDARVVACAELSAGVVLVALGPPDGDVDSQDYEVKVVAGGVAHDAFVADAYGGAGRGAAYYVAAVRDWWHDGHTLAFVTSSKAVEIGSVEVAATGPRSLFHMNDTDKAVLPVTEEGEDVSPVGVAVELGDEVVAEPCLGVEEARGLPRVWSLTDEGRLIGWWVFESTRIGRENCARVGLAAPREEAEVAAPQGEAEVAAPRGEAEVAAPRGEAEVAAPPGEAVAAPSGESGAPAAGAAAPAGAFGSSSFGSSFGGASQFGSSGFGGSLAPKTASGAPKATSSFGSYAKAGSAFSSGSEKSASPFGAVAARESPFGASAGARESPVGTTSPFGSGSFDKESDKAKESPFGTSSFGKESPFGSSLFGAKPAGSKESPFETSSFGAKPAESKESPFGTSSFGAKPAESKESPFGTSSFGKESPFGTSSFGAKPAESKESPFGSSSFGAKPAESKESPFGTSSFGAKPAESKESPFGTSSFGKESPFGTSSFGAKPAESKESPFGTSSFGAKPAESKESPFGTSSFGKESPFGSSSSGAQPAESKESPFGTSSFGAKPAESKESPFGTSSFGKESPFGSSSSGAQPAESKESPFGTSSFGTGSTSGAKESPFGSSSFGAKPAESKESPFGTSSFGAKPAESKESPFGTSSFGTGSTSGAKESPFGMSSFGAKTAEGDNVKVSPFGRNSFGGKESPFGASSFGAKESPFGPNSGAKEKESPFGSSSFEAKARGDNGAKESPFGTSSFGAASPFGSSASSAKGSPAVEESPFGSFGGNAETTKKPIGSGLFGGVDSKTQSPAAVPANPFGSSDASAFKGAGAKSAFQMGDLGLSDSEASEAEQVSESEASASAASASEASQEESGARPTEEKSEANGEEVESEAGEWEDEEESEVSENEEESETDAAPAQSVPSRATPAKPTATPTSDAADQVPGDSEAQPARTNESSVEVAPPLASRVEEETPGVPPRLSKTTEEVVSPGPEAVDFPPTLSAFAGIEPVPTVRGNAIAQKSVEIYNETGGVLQVLEHNVGALGRYIERMTSRTADAALSEAALDTADVWGLAAGDVVAEISAKYAAAAAQQLATLRSYDARLGALTHELEKSNLTRLRADRLLSQVATIIGDGTSLRARPLDDAHHQLQTGVRQKLHRVQSLQEDIQRAMIPLKARLAGGAVLDNVESCIYNMSEEVFARLGELDALARKVAAVELETVPAARDHGAEAAVRRRWQMAAELSPVQVRVVSL